MEESRPMETCEKKDVSGDVLTPAKGTDECLQDSGIETTPASDTPTTSLTAQPSPPIEKLFKEDDHCVIGFVGDAAAAKTIGDEWATIKTEADDSNADLGACRVEKESQLIADTGYGEVEIDALPNLASEPITPLQPIPLDLVPLRGQRSQEDEASFCLTPVKPGKKRRRIRKDPDPPSSPTPYVCASQPSVFETPQGTMGTFWAKYGEEIQRAPIKVSTRVRIRLNFEGEKKLQTNDSLPKPVVASRRSLRLRGVPPKYMHKENPGRLARKRRVPKARQH